MDEDASWFVDRALINWMESPNKGPEVAAKRLRSRKRLPIWSSSRGWAT